MIVGPRLSVNVNKVATLRNSRGGDVPSVTDAVRVCLDAGATGITVHPRADERHIRRADVTEISAWLRAHAPGIEFNIEGDPRPDLIDLVHAVRPDQCTLVPVTPGEITSHAGWSPDLSPEEEQTWELGYNLAYKVLNFSASVYYKRINNLIESFVSSVPYVFVDQNGDEATRMVALTNFGNIGSNKSFGLSVYGTVDLPFGLSLRGNMDMYSYDPSVKPGYETYLNAGTFLMYNGYVSASYNFKKKIYFESSYSFQSKWRTFQGVNANLNVLNIGVKKNILKNKGSIGFVVVNLFKDKWDFTNSINTPYLVQYRNLSTPFRSFNLNFSYKIGNFKMKNPEQRGVSNDDLK